MGVGRDGKNQKGERYEGEACEDERSANKTRGTAGGPRSPEVRAATYQETPSGWVV